MSGKETPGNGTEGIVDHLNENDEAAMRLFLENYLAKRAQRYRSHDRLNEGYMLIVSELSLEQLNVTRGFLQSMGLNCSVEHYQSLTTES